MKQREIIQQLKKFSKEKPSSQFAESSKRLILTEEQERLLFLPGFLKPALVGSFVLVLVAFLGFYLVGVQNNEPVYSSLDGEKLNQELDSLTISIELDEIEYSQAAINNTIASALSEISNDNIRHLNRELLEEEQGQIDFDYSNGDEIDELLDTVIF